MFVILSIYLSLHFSIFISVHLSRTGEGVFLQRIHDTLVQTTNTVAFGGAMVFINC